ncbi:MAG: hypothetical protein P8179_20965 [Candidatus Thiodiazotropha sp.]
MTAWIGLTPHQHASDENTRMLEISKQGGANFEEDVYPWCDNRIELART